MAQPASDSLREPYGLWPVRLLSHSVLSKNSGEVCHVPSFRDLQQDPKPGFLHCGILTIWATRKTLWGVGPVIIFKLFSILQRGGGTLS